MLPPAGDEGAVPHRALVEQFVVGQPGLMRFPPPACPCAAAQSSVASSMSGGEVGARLWVPLLRRLWPFRPALQRMEGAVKAA